jgi:large subunit ribosomal protein L22
MEYTATAKYIRMAPRKIRLIADAVRGLQAERAMTVLMSTPKHAAKPIITLIHAAVAGAKEKKADITMLKVASIDVMGGPVLKRWHAASKGMAHPFKKRMSHVKVILKEEEKTKTG